MTSEPAMGGAVIILATFAFAGVAFVDGLPAYAPADCGPRETVVQYLPMPEPAPIVLPIAATWPILDRAERIGSVDEISEPAISDDDKVAPSRRHRRHFRRHRRR